jgi:FixJ family two-component response regulator
MKAPFASHAVGSHADSSESGIATVGVCSHEGRTTGEQPRPLITIIEDDGAVRFAINSVMRSAGFRTATFDSAEAFLDAGLLHEKVCLILDVQMAGRSGLELQRHLLTAGAAPPPIIFVSARASAQDAALRNGAVAFLQKPFSAEELLRAVHQALD